jgi:hypothetical protein
MKSRLRIPREDWPEVTEQPHFILDLHAAGYTYACDDLYFDGLAGLAPELEGLEHRVQFLSIRQTKVRYL